jgi:hypothetical protein
MCQRERLFSISVIMNIYIMNKWSLPTLALTSDSLLWYIFPVGLLSLKTILAHGPADHS